MTDPSTNAASGALEELLEVSPQVDAAVILTRTGSSLLASAPAANGRMSERFAATAARILDAAEQARAELGREPVVQVEVATLDGHVFVVADANHVVAAVTAADPTVGLVFYDLKTALRTLREQGSDTATTPAALVVPVTSSSAGSETDSSEGDSAAADGSTENSDATTVKVGRWRRRK